jgi:RNAse (barnase) inhibitor barstar
MKVITLDALGWQSPRDFYAALLPELEAPAWHGRNLDALNDSLNSGGINGVEPS